ncbi:MAG: hypothetical protein ABWX72_19720 [Arthrobacter sp.]
MMSRLPIDAGDVSDAAASEYLEALAVTLEDGKTLSLAMFRWTSSIMASSRLGEIDDGHGAPAEDSEIEETRRHEVILASADIPRLGAGICAVGRRFPSPGISP